MWGLNVSSLSKSNRQILFSRVNECKTEFSKKYESTEEVLPYLLYGVFRRTP